MRQLLNTNTLLKSRLQLPKSIVLTIAHSELSNFESDNVIEQLLSIEGIIKYYQRYKLKLYISM
jgi:hypothetical protein